MSTIKENILLLIKDLPDNSDYEDIMYAIYVRQKIEKGIAEIDAGQYVTHEEVKERTNKWRK